MVIYLKDEYKTDRNIAYKLAQYLERTYMIDIISSAEIIYDPDNDKYSKLDNIILDNIFYYDENNRKFENLIWLFRIKLNLNNLYKHGITLLDIKTEFIKYWN